MRSGGCRSELRVRLSVSFHGIPMGVPHTRPLGVTAHATQPEPDRGLPAAGRPAAGAGQRGRLLELRLGEDDRAALGFAVHVPHYLAQAAYPAAAVTLMESIQRATGLLLPGDALREAAQRTDEEIARQVEGSDEVAEVVQVAGGAVRRVLRGPGRPARRTTRTTCPPPRNSARSSSGSWPSSRATATCRTADGRRPA